MGTQGQIGPCGFSLRPGDKQATATARAEPTTKNSETHGAAQHAAVGEQQRNTVSLANSWAVAPGKPPGPPGPQLRALQRPKPRLPRQRSASEPERTLDSTEKALGPRSLRNNAMTESSPHRKRKQQILQPLKTRDAKKAPPAARPPDRK